MTICWVWGFVDEFGQCKGSEGSEMITGASSVQNRMTAGHFHE